MLELGLDISARRGSRYAGPRNTAPDCAIVTTISLPEFTEYFHQRLLLAAEQWLSALRAIADEPLLPEAMLEQLVLPMQSVTDRLLSLSALNSAFPAVLRDIADAHVQQQARDYLSRVAAELL